MIIFGFFAILPLCQLHNQLKKAVRGSLRKKAFNDQRKRVMKEVIKKIEKLSKTDKSQASGMLSSAFQAIDKAAQKGVIKKNNAARKSLDCLN